MTNVVNAQMGRVTIVAPTSRVDLALPVDVPLVHLLPWARALRLALLSLTWPAFRWLCPGRFP